MGEIALALVLSIGAGLLVRSFDQLLTNELGLEPEGRLALQVFAYGEDGNPSPDFLQRSLEEIGGIPGVDAVAITTDLPLADDETIASIDINLPFTIDDRATPAVGEEPTLSISSISEDYPEVMGVAVTRGRAFTITDNADAAPVVMINEALARRHFPEENPIGKNITINFGGIIFMMMEHARGLIGHLLN